MSQAKLVPDLRYFLFLPLLFGLLSSSLKAQEDDFQFVDEPLFNDYYDQGYGDVVSEVPDLVADDLTVEGEVIQIELGVDHSCVLLAGGRIKCWGMNLAGQLGDGTSTWSNVPVDVVDIDNAVAISAGYDHTCAVLDDGQVACWGSNREGQLGNDTGEPWALTPTLVPGVEDAVAIAAGAAHTCTVLQQGDAMCWGLNDTGQLGDGTFVDSDTPINVVDINLAESISSSGDHTCVIERTGFISTRLQCWGRNSHGQIGDGASADTNVPVPVRGIVNPVQVGAGINHTCVATQSKVAFCWGANSRGQAGVGHAHGPVTIPVILIGYSLVTDISSGWMHSCARAEDGFVRCWGSNDNGQLGTGNYRADPATWRPNLYVYGLWGNVKTVNAGRSHSCAILNDRSVACWGANDAGQLGDGTNTQSNKPVWVAF